MIKIELTFDEIDYQGVIKALLPLISRHKITRKALEMAIIGKLKGKSNSEKDEVASAFINEHKTEIINRAENEADLLGLKINIKDISSTAN